MTDYIIVAVISFGMLGLGNLIGDQGTIRDCATKGHANMAGGGSISCEVKKESADKGSHP